MKKLSFLFVLLGLLASLCTCRRDEPYSHRSNYSDGYSSGDTYYTPEARFVYQVQQPLSVVFTNKSTDATSYVWDFGDGNTSTEANPEHRYKGKGVYKVVLTAKNKKFNDVAEAVVTVEEPTRCYLAGYTIKSIPSQNQYYQVRFTDQYTFSADNFGTTSWYLLSDANLPKEITFTNPTQITGFNAYWCTLWKSSSKNGSNEVKSMRWGVTKEELFTSFPVSLTNTDPSGGQVTAWFIWK